MRVFLLFSAICLTLTPCIADEETLLSCEGKNILSRGKSYTLSGTSSVIISDYDVAFSDAVYLITEKNEREIRATAITSNATMSIHIDRVTGIMKQTIGSNLLTYQCSVAEPKF